MPDYYQLHDKVFTVDNMLSADECHEYINWASSVGFVEAPINTGGSMTINKNVRNNTRAMIDDVPRALALFEKAKHYLPEKFEGWQIEGLNERLRFYRYDVGQQFDWHYDGHFLRHVGEASLLTFMIYLNHEFEGGHTTVMDIDVLPETGKLLCFHHRVLHKGQPVTKGIKYVLRSDVMYRATQT